MIEEIFHEFCWDRTVKLQNFIIPDHFDLLWFTVIWKLGNAFLLKEKAFWWSVRGENKICWNHILYIDVDVMIFFLYMYSCRYYREYQESSYAILDYTFRITNALLRILCTVSDFFFWYRGLVKFLATNNY